MKKEVCYNKSAFCFVFFQPEETLHSCLIMSYHGLLFHFFFFISLIMLKKVDRDQSIVQLRHSYYAPSMYNFGFSIVHMVD